VLRPEAGHEPCDLVQEVECTALPTVVVTPSLVNKKLLICSDLCAGQVQYLGT
jgi:hypothetical protein